MHTDRRPGETIEAWRRRKEREKQEAHSRGDTVAAGLIGAMIGSSFSSGSSSSSSSGSDWGSSSSSDSGSSFSGGGGDSGGGGSSDSF